MNFGVIIVTYNRRELLRECIACAAAQTIPFQAICVVDNHSTDGTREFLDALALPGLEVHHLPENIGGAGGFSYGLSQLSQRELDWILIIDDDAMLERTYIEEIARAIRETDYLAYSGTVITHGAIDTSHRRRLTSRLFMTYAPVAELAYQSGSFVYDISTFCGLVISASLVREIGLPRQEYFIWFDDTEYCLRFHSRSRILNVCRAVLNHKTAAPGNAPVISWKHYYGFRNSIDIGRAYSTCPPVYLAYIHLNHQAHIAIDRLLLALDRLTGQEGQQQREIRRYRIQLYRDVLRECAKAPGGPDARYLPGSGPQQTPGAI